MKKEFQWWKLFVSLILPGAILLGIGAVGLVLIGWRIEQIKKKRKEQ